MTSHYTVGSTTALHEFGGLLGQPLDTFIWALTISWSWLLAHVWRDPKLTYVVCFMLAFCCDWGISRSFFVKMFLRKRPSVFGLEHSNHPSCMDERSRLGKAPLHYFSTRGPSDLHTEFNYTILKLISNFYVKLLKALKIVLSKAWQGVHSYILVLRSSQMPPTGLHWMLQYQLSTS
jgi:hypothetical protein